MASPSVDGVTLDSTTAELGGSITGTIDGTYDAPDTNSDIVLDVLAYFSGDGEQIVDTVTLSGGDFSVPFTLPVPNDDSYLGDQWTYIGLDGGSWMSLKGKGVTIGEPVTVSESNVSIPTCSQDAGTYQPGGTLGLTADVRNDNDAAADVELTWTVGGATFTPAVVTVPAGSTEAVTHDVVLDDSTINAMGGYGDHSVSVTIAQVTASA